MKEKFRLSMLWIGFLIIVWLGSSIIRDVIILITKNNLNNQIINIFVFVLTFILILLMLKITPFQELGKFLDKIKLGRRMFK